MVGGVGKRQGEGYEARLGAGAVRAMLGQPGGHVRRPRLPITDQAALEGIRKALVGAGLLED